MKFNNISAISACAALVIVSLIGSAAATDLKIGGTDKVLETLAAENDAISPVFDIWMTWEKGKSTPEVALAGLENSGFTAIVEALHDSE